ncbi:MAG: hypothetical protein DWQ44_02770 [Bacteroidetes bacterium]|nr:MAG: hypothetical protein DWQ33_06500 [Bacteroidota bacterium]REK04891.1 MAG: hypothetical protein DWQ39_06665 [Bacteroidota bacterium]REK36363.1 MAG: hypothetical protein DWQ44_02770 [Bacteroidota bacterium]REK50971.1 MAG: hypothetical protein DWQ48_02450 [Bacteroidota bacterium]
MKSIIKIFFLSLVLLQACDRIEAPYINEEAQNAAKGVVYLSESSVIVDGDTINFSNDNSTPPKKVLAEDYTGILCGNCPVAGIKLNDTIKPGYGDRLVIISVHAGFFANPCPTGLACSGSQPAGALETDYRTPVGDAWNNFFGNSAAGNPNALIDRMEYPIRQHIKFPSVWAARIQERSVLPSKFALRIQNIYDSSSRGLKTAIQARSIGTNNGNYKLQVVLVEDNIRDWQVWYNPTRYDPDFIHHHVLRASVNTSFGEEIATGSVSNGQLFLKAYNANVNASWVQEKVSVIAFVYDADTYEVLQVEELKIIP